MSDDFFVGIEKLSRSLRGLTMSSEMNDDNELGKLSRSMSDLAVSPNYESEDSSIYKIKTRKSRKRKRHDKENQKNMKKKRVEIKTREPRKRNRENNHDTEIRKKRKTQTKEEVQEENDYEAFVKRELGEEFKLSLDYVRYN